MKAIWGDGAAEKRAKERDRDVATKTAASRRPRVGGKGISLHRDDVLKSRRKVAVSESRVYPEAREAYRVVGKVDGDGGGR